MYSIFNTIRTESSVLFNNIKYHVGGALFKLKSLIPYIVWPGQEVDVHLVFTDSDQVETTTGNKGKKGKGSIKLRPTTQALFALSDGGVSFSTEVDLDKTTWCLDHSLAGPMRVRFVRPCKTKIFRTKTLFKEINLGAMFPT